MFRNFYRCEACRHAWTDVWSATCDDDCPNCGTRHISPYKSEDVEGNPSTQRIRDFNDALRTTLTGGKVVMTASVNALPPDIVVRALSTMQVFTDFDPNNDPHGEHDFGKFELAEETFFWKIEYYDKSVEAGSEDPADPEQTTRVLTLMLASDY